MARTATRRPAARRPVELTSAPNGQLPARPASWPRNSVLVVAVGLALFGAAPLTGRPGWANPVLVAALATSIAVAVLGRRTAARQRLTDRLVEALTPGLGLRQPDRRTVTVRSWSRGWVGVPRRIELRYAPNTDDTDSLWRADLIAACSRRLLAEYELRRHDRRRCRLSLKLVPHHDKVVTPQVQVRAERAVLEMLGPTATVTSVQYNDAGELAGLEAKHQAGPRLAAAPYRHRIERVISTMLPGRWRAQWDLELDSVRFELRPAMPQVMPHPPVDVDEKNLFRIPLGVDEDGDQVEWNLRGAPHLMVVGKTNSGKSLDVQTPVATPTGWTTMGELRDGDTVFDETGQPCTVTKAHPIRHGRPCYELEFSDGSTIVADAEHLWWTEARLDRVSQSNRRHKNTCRSEPRTTRMTGERLAQLRERLLASSPTDALSLPDFARLTGMAPSHPVLREIAAKVGPHGSRERPVGQFRYAAQTVQQTQKVSVYDRAAGLAYLAHRAESPRWRYSVTAATLTAAAASVPFDDDKELTVAQVAALLDTTSRQACQIMRGSHELIRGTATRVVDLQVPARTVRRRLPGPAVTIYLTRDLLSELIAWGEGLTKDRHIPRPAGAVRSTEEIASTLVTATGHANHSVPVAAAVQYPTTEQPIPAYALGAWLGDGDSWGAALTSADPEIAMRIEADGVNVDDLGRPLGKKETYRARRYALRGIRAQLIELGLMRNYRTANDRTRRKHIPIGYLIASEQQRRDLLAGLLDTDGTVGSSGAALFDNTNHTLALQVHELACSLGYRATLREGRAKLYGRDCGPKWTVSFTTTDQVFKLERKHLLHKERTAQANIERTRSRYIVAVRPVPSMPVRCITVDSPNRLYLVGKSFIPTHNTVVINGVVMEAAARGWQVRLADPKRIEFLGLRGYPNVQLIATTVLDMVVLIYQAKQEMERRYALIEAGEVVEADLEPMLVVLDEYRDFYASVNEWYAGIKISGMPARCPVFEQFSSIARKGRSARIHLIVGTQRPDADFLTGEMRDNFAARISLGPLSPQGAMMMWEAPHVGVAVPRIAGRGTALDARDRPVEVQAYWTPDPRRNSSPTDLDVLRQLRPAEALHEPLQVWLDQELLEELDEKGRSQEWKAVQRAELRPAQDDGSTIAEGQLNLAKPPAAGQRPPSSAPILTSSLAGPPHPMLLPAGGFSTRGGGDLWSEVRNATGAAPAEGGAVVLRLDRKRRAGNSDQPDMSTPLVTAPPEPLDASGASDQPATPPDENPDDDDQYEATASLPAGQVQPGDLVLLEDTGVWATVEAAEFDVLDEDYICIDWRSDDDDAGSMSVPQDDEIPTRRALASAGT